MSEEQFNTVPNDSEHYWVQLEPIRIDEVERRTDQLELIGQDHGVLLIKPDAIHDRVVPTIFETLFEEGVHLVRLYEIELDDKDGIYLYRDNMVNSKSLQDFEFGTEGIRNLMGKNLLLVCASATDEPIDDKLRRLKGSPFNPNPRGNIRGRVARYVPDDLEDRERTRRLVRSRIHYHRDEAEKTVWHNFLRKKGFRFEGDENHEA